MQPLLAALPLRLLLLLSLTVAVVVSTALPAPAIAAPAPAGCGTGSWIAGTTEVCDGVFVYRDYVYDDYGSRIGDPSAPNTGSLSATNGKVRYTTDINSADLIGLRLWIAGGQLHVRFELNTLRDVDSTFAAIAIDDDNDPLTGGGVWLDVCATEQPHGTGICATPLTSTGWDTIHVFENGDPNTTLVDPATNVIEGSIALPAGTTWRVQAVTGIRDRRLVMNVAFRGGIEDQLTTSILSGVWFEERQSDALATGDISQFGATVVPAQLVPGVDAPAPSATGYHERIYISDITVAPGTGGATFAYDQDAEGMDYVGVPAGASSLDQSFKFYGRNQPYGIYVPNQPGPHGLQLALHGLGANHASLINAAGMQQNVGEALNRIVVVPLGRGPAGWYDEASERDVLDVIADVRANYDVDPDQIFSGGYSMGGYGGYRMATLYPDLFAGFIAWVGTFEGRSAKGIQVFDFLKNLRQVPGAMLYAGEDELVQVNVYLDIQPRLDALAYEHVLYFHPLAEHLTFAVADDWIKEAAWSAGRTLQKAPRRVTYRNEPFTWSESIGILHDKAYWVSEIRGVNTARGDYVDVDFSSSGCGGSYPATTRTAPDPTGTDPIPWTAQEYLVTGNTPINPNAFLGGDLMNVASVRVDVSAPDGACLSSSGFSYLIKTDGPARIDFSDGRSLELSSAGTHVGSVPEPSAAASLAFGVAVTCALVRRRKMLRLRAQSRGPRGFLIASLAILMFVALVAPVHAASIYEEAVLGDLSGDHLAPTPLPLSFSLGSNIVSGTFSFQDEDFFTTSVPSGFAITSVLLLANTSPEPFLEFVGMFLGPQYTSRNNYYAYAQAFYNSGSIGTDLLPAMAASHGNFTDGIPAGTYSFWADSSNALPQAYSFDFQVSAVPEPGTALLVLSGLAALASRRRA